MKQPIATLVRERMAALMTYLTENCCQGMPGECIGPMETALARCASRNGNCP